MIETTTIPTVQLGSNSRLLLMVGKSRSPMAFTEPQLRRAVELTTEAMHSLVSSHGMPRIVTGGVVYLPPDGKDPEELKAFEEAVAWLGYVGMAGGYQMPDGKRAVLLARHAKLR